MRIKLTIRILLLVLGFSLIHEKLLCQLKPYVIFSGPDGTGTTLIGSSITINGIASTGVKGSVGGVKLVKTTGNATIKAHIHSWDKVSITNTNVIQGDIIAGNSSAVPGLPPGTAISIGSSLMLTGNIHSRGDIVIGGGSVTGSVNVFPGTYFSSNPTPSILPIGNSPVIPPQPTLPTPKPDLLTNPIYNSTTNFTTTADAFPIDGIAGHGVYNNVIFSGNKTLTLRGPGIYVFNSMTMTGNSNKIVFDFQNKPKGKFFVYIKGNADMGKVDAGYLGITLTGEAASREVASRVWIEVQGPGTGTTSPTASFLIANGAGGGSKILSTIYATRAAINIGSGTGSTSLTGALFSKTAVNIQSGVEINYEPFLFCEPPNVDAGPDEPLNIEINTPPTTVTGTSTTPGVTFSWQALNGGIITSTSNTSNTSTITVTESGTFVLTATTDVDCFSRDTVVVTNPIGGELKTVYLNNPVNSPFFIITPDSYIVIDIIMVDPNDSTTLKALLQTAPYGLRNIMDNGASEFIITGEFPIVNLHKLNFEPLINYCRPYYEEITHSGVVTTAGDTSVRSWLVRNGYNLNGEGIKVGVISNSFNTITDASLAPFNTNTAVQDIANGDLPAAGVTVLKQLPGKRSDEGRGMLQIIHDIAPAAQLYFRTGSETAGDFAQGIRKLRDEGCDIIVDDLTYITEQFLTDGVVAQAVNEVTTGIKPVIYFSACGNFGRKSYESFYDSTQAPLGFTGTAHDFDPSATNTDIYQKVTFEPGKYIIVLQWVDDNYSISNPNQPRGTKSDLDLFTTPNTNGTQLFGNNRINIGGDAIEIMTFTMTSKTESNFLIVNKTPGTKPARIKLVAFRGGLTFDEYNIGTSTIVGQANAKGAIAIGAARYNRLDTVEYFSSAGGTTVFTQNGTSVDEEIREKPELVGPDGVNTTVKLGLGDADGDSYYNFFGTSAAAPHAAGVAALIMHGRKKMFGPTTITTPNQMRDLLTRTAKDMLTGGFDFASGYGLIDADAAMRDFAAPTPFIDQLILGTTTLTVKGVNLSQNSVIHYGNTPITPTTVSPDNTEATAPKPTIIGNQPVRVYTPPRNFDEEDEPLDGGFSNSLYFGTKHITVIAKDTARKYAEVITLVPTVLVDGTPLAQTNPKLTLRDLGLQDLTLTVPPEATNPGDIGAYKLGFNQTKPDDTTLYQKYTYEFIEGTLTVQKLPVTITVQNMSVEFGTKIPNPTFTYQFDGANIPDAAAFLSTLKSAHQSQVVKDVLGLVNAEAVVIENGEAVVIENAEAVVIENGQSYVINPDSSLTPIVNAQSLQLDNCTVKGTTQVCKIDSTGDYTLTNSDIQDLSFLATVKSLQDTRVVNSNTVVDITQESILDFNKNAAQTQMTNSLSNADAKGLVDVRSYTNGEAVVIENAEAVVIENGEAVVIENAEAVVLENGEAVVIENGEAVVIDNGEAVVIENAEAVVIENGEAVVIDNAGEHFPYRFSDDRTAVIVDVNEIGRGITLLKSLNVITGLTIGNHFLMPGTLTNNNLELTYIAGIVSIVDPCPILTRKPFTNFNSTTQKETTLWVTVTTKISRQLAQGDSLFFTAGNITFNNIEAYKFGTIGTSTPITTESIPNGVIVANLPAGAAPKTRFENNRWITQIPVPYSSTSDIFISGAVIKSNNRGFKKLSGGNTVVQGKFYSNICNFSDQWTYAMAAYQPPFDFTAVTPDGKVASVNGAINGINYRAGAPIPFVGTTGSQTPHLVSGGSGGGGSNYTGSTSSYENFTACPVIPAACSAAVTRASVVNQEEIEVIPSAGEVQITPNPATNYITLSFVPVRTGSSDIVLFNIDGRKVFETNNGICEAAKRYVRNIDVSKLVSGVYVVQLRSAGKITNKKIIINR